MVASRRGQNPENLNQILEDVLSAHRDGILDKDPAHRKFAEGLFHMFAELEPEMMVTVLQAMAIGLRAMSTTKRHIDAVHESRERV